MKTGFYPKLAFDSIRKNRKIYIPYILTCSGMTMMFYIIDFLANMTELDNMSGGESTRNMLKFGVWVIAIFSLVFLLYTNSFLMRRRQKEFGLYNILGMGKKNLSTVYLWETLIVYVISMFSGLVCGIAFSKMAELGLIRMISGAISYDFTINMSVVFDTLAIFGAIFVLFFVKGIITLWKLNAVSLLKSENAGEKPPRANYLLGIGGVLILAGAYYIAVSIKSPLLALSWFFVAVVMVIVATYMICISGSVMLCRILQKNKKYYYKKNHFVSVSSMAYRMKRNGAGLASICVLSTMVLVMMLGSASLFFGAEDSLRTRYPKDISVSADFVSYEDGKGYTPEKVKHIVSEIDSVAADYGVKPENTEKYVSVRVTGMLKDGRLNVNPELVNEISPDAMEKFTQIYLVSLDEYNECTGANETLGENQILIYCIRRDYSDSSITMTDGTVLNVKGKAENMMSSGDAAMDILPSMFIVTNDMEKLCGIIDSEFTDEEYFCRPVLSYGFDTELKSEDEISLAESVREYIRELDITGDGGFYSSDVECREEQRGDFYGVYGGIFFLGIILSLVFIIAAVLIIYYKQITEGYEDESRFAIMQKVGMTKKDIRKSVNSQMLTVFFMPLVMAVMHLAFAFPIVKKLLALFNLRNVPLMIAVLAVTILVFGVFYAVVYKITSNVYFSIVSENKSERN
ncbi:MAG: FtsX-like permease family protein [Porcipelethomonas sp.]